MRRTCLISTVIALFLCTGNAFAQDSKRVLFIGNSYTEVNNLPQMVANVAQSMGDEVVYNSNTPGGCTFMQHCANQSMSLIRQGGWDVVVLQEQSQYPSFPQAQVEAEVFPYAQRLVDSVYAHSPCAEPMFYMTWGRKNGDAANAVYFPVLGTYEGMDSMLCERYTYMAHTYDAALCPVGRVWRYLRQHYDDLELYQSDGSHPSVAGTYAAACAFYVMIFHRDPLLIHYAGGLDDNTAQVIRSAVRAVVFEHISDWTRPEPQAVFDIESILDPTISLTNHSAHANELTWDFGDGNILTTSDTAVTHTYANNGNYTITLTASRHCMSDTATETIVIQGTGIADPEDTQTDFTFYPNPAQNILTVRANGEVVVLDITGKTVLNAGPVHGKAILDISNLKSGSYFIICGNHSKTFVKQ